MTRGRRPLNALNDALEIAGRRGSVEEVTGKRGCAFDLIICEPGRNVFVKVKRSQTSFTYVLEILQRYQREIASLHRVALTQVTAREFWVRSPNRTWQFFLIRHDSIVEIRADGMYIPRESLPVWTADMSGTAGDGKDDPFS
ncbi:MAG: hypothetical protein Q8R70_07685, partial [Methanoregula sp.]|nr:hypothetical protein [Methanoregula sp.]